MFTSKMFLPDEKLKDWIKVFWFLEGKGQGKTFHARGILPDGCATISLLLKGSLHSNVYKNGIPKRGIYVIPPVLKRDISYLSDDIYLIDIQLKPCVFHKLFNIPTLDLNDTVYPIEELSLDFDSSILEKLFEVKDDKNMVYSLLNSFLINLFDKFKFSADEIFYNINQLYQDGDLNKFFKEQDLSLRQLERKVKNYTGLTPKGVSRLGRFYSILDYMKYRQFDIEFSKLAQEYKFSDQSHFNREFKSFTNQTPKQFINDVNSFPQFIGLCNLIKNYK